MPMHATRGLFASVWICAHIYIYGLCDDLYELIHTHTHTHTLTHSLTHTRSALLLPHKQSLFISPPLILPHPPLSLHYLSKA